MSKIIPLIFFVAFAGLLANGLFRDNPDALPSVLEGRPAPAVTVVPLGEKTLLKDSDLRGGGVKVVNFWASWCAPCRAEHASLTELAAKGVPVYGVNYKDNPQNALGFLQELGDPYKKSGADEKGRMGLEWGVYGVPETYIIDGKGQIVLRFAGPITKRHLKDTILPAIEKAE